MPSDQAIQDLADHIWRVHPNEIAEAGYAHVSHGGKYENPRAAWYADQIKALCRAAANAVLEAKVAGLRAMIRVNMLRYGPPGTSHEEINAAIDAALASGKPGEAGE